MQSINQHLLRLEQSTCLMSLNKNFSLLQQDKQGKWYWQQCMTMLADPGTHTKWWNLICTCSFKKTTDDIEKPTIGKQTGNDNSEQNLACGTQRSNALGRFVHVMRIVKFRGVSTGNSGDWIIRRKHIWRQLLRTLIYWKTASIHSF